MYIQEAAKQSGTTKKAIEYYCLKGLLTPQLSEKGYRNFSEEDVVCLNKISLLRSLVFLLKISGIFSIEMTTLFFRESLKNRKLCCNGEKNRMIF